MYKVKNTLLFLLICISAQLLSQGNSTLYTARQIAMGYQRSFGSGQQYVNANPALLYKSPDKWSFMASGEKRYFTDINGVLLGAEKQINNLSGFAFYATDFGLKEWKENQMAVSYGRKLTDQLSIGASFILSQLRLQEYGNDTKWDISLGISYTPTERSAISLMIENVAPHTLEEFQKTYVVLGGQYTLSDNIRMSVEASSPDDHIGGYRWSYAIEYRIFEVSTIILGVHSDAAAPSVGIDLEIDDHVHLNVAASRHSYIGSSAALSLSYFFN